MEEGYIIMERKLLILIVLISVILVLSGLGVVAVTTNVVMTIDNHPPSPPQIKGPQNRPPGTYKWTFKSFDSDGDNITYRIDWGDGEYENWSKPYSSGVEVAYNHTYTSYADYVITAQAKDTHEALSNESTMTVTITKSKQINNLVQLQILNIFIQRFLIRI